MMIKDIYHLVLELNALKIFIGEINKVKDNVEIYRKKIQPDREEISVKL